MVVFLHLLSAAIFIVSHAVAKPAPVNTINALLARQTSSTFDPSDLPEQCRQQCLHITDGSPDCANSDCICKDSTISNVAKCLGCGVRTEGSGLTLQTAQEIVDQIVSDCNSAGASVKGVTVSAKDNGVSRTGASSAGAVAVAALGAVLAVM